jgi:hypothetical protein
MCCPLLGKTGGIVFVSCSTPEKWMSAVWRLLPEKIADRSDFFAELC